jgi:hypothetical protein
MRFAALRAGENDSGFRVEPAMTRFLVFAGRGVWHRPAESAKAQNAALRAGMYDRWTAALRALSSLRGRFFASPGVPAKNKGE